VVKYGQKLAQFDETTTKKYMGEPLAK